MIKHSINKKFSMSRIPWKNCLQIGVIALFMAVTMRVTMITSSQVTEEYSPLIDAVNKIKIEATFAHLKIEQLIYGDTSVDIDSIWEHFYQAEWYAQAMLEGGQKDEWRYVALENKKLQKNILEVLNKIRTFRAIAKERLTRPDQSKIGSSIEQQFDRLFYDFLKQSDNVEVIIVHSKFNSIKLFQRAKFTMVVLFCLFICIIGLIVYRYHKKQSSNLLKLKLSNKQILLSKQKLALHVKQTPLGVIQWDLDCKVTEWNKAAKNIFGYSSEEAIGRYVIGLVISKTDEEIAKKIWCEVLNQKEGSQNTFENITKDNNNIICEWYNTPLIDEKGSTIGVASLIMDITERKRAEESNALLSRAIEQADETIIISDAEGNIQYVNPAFEKTTGYTAKEVISQNLKILRSDQHDDSFYNQMWQTLSSGNQWHGEIINKKKDGTTFVEDAVISPVFNSHREIINYVAAKIDITETKRLQALEARAERLEMAGIIAGQVAHDFNNLLAPITAYPELIRNEIPIDNIGHAYLDTIEEAAKKIVEINQDLLTLGRRGHYNQEILNLNNIILNIVNEMKLRTKTVNIEMKLCEEIMNFRGGSAQIHRMLSNLLVNAFDAIDYIGNISIKTENYYANETSVAFGLIPKGEYIKLTISDNGCGIPVEIIQKILDTFFSTKTANKKTGSGLGLSVVDSVMKDHDGYLDLQSKIGYGTSFYLYFPIVRECSNDDDLEQSKGCTERILVVDDDNAQRELTTRLLKQFGYKVQTVESGEKAVDFLREKSQDIIIIDMVMPNGINGTETYRRILEINPNQKSLIVSGFSESDSVINALKQGAGAFIKKPFNSKEIGSAVRAELDRKVENVWS